MGSIALMERGGGPVAINDHGRLQAKFCTLVVIGRWTPLLSDNTIIQINSCKYNTYFHILLR